MATIDKFYAVMFPFKYGKRRACIFKSAIAVTTVFNAVLSTAIITGLSTFGQQAYMIVSALYNVILSLMFLTILILYVFIIAKIVRNQRNLSKVNDTG